MLLVFCYEMFTLNIVLLFTVWKTISSVKGALTLSFVRREEHPTCKHWVMGCWCGYLSGARCRLFVYGPADGTASQNAIVCCSRQTTTPAPHHSVFLLQAGCASCHSTNSVKALKANCRAEEQLNYHCSLWTLLIYALNATQIESLWSKSVKSGSFYAVYYPQSYSQSRLARPLCCV